MFVFCVIAFPIHVPFPLDFLLYLYIFALLAMLETALLFGNLFVLYYCVLYSCTNIFSISFRSGLLLMIYLMYFENNEGF